MVSMRDREEGSGEGSRKNEREGDLRRNLSMLTRMNDGGRTNDVMPFGFRPFPSGKTASCSL